METEQAQRKIVVTKKQLSAETCKRAQANSTITLTFGDQAENHRGMQKLGNLADEGFTIKDLEETKKKFEAKNCTCELIDLNAALSGTKIESEEAKILIVRKGVDFLDPEKLNADQLFQEQMCLEWDTKAFMYGQVRNKHARSNLCYGEENQEPDYMSKKGRIVAFKEIPATNLVRNHLGDYFGDKGKDLVGEGNYYFDASTCGIGFHGDAERKKVIAVRLGASLPLHYQWFLNSEPVGKRVNLTLKHGDIYAMSEKASGFDWKTKKKATLRHAAGAKKFLTIKERKPKSKKLREEDDDDSEDSSKALRISKGSKKIEKL